MGSSTYTDDHQGRLMSNTATQTLILALTSIIDDRIRVAMKGYASNEWMNSKTAAAYIDAPVSRVHDLVMTQKLVPHYEGSRLLFRRSELDEYLEGRA